MQGILDGKGEALWRQLRGCLRPHSGQLFYTLKTRKKYPLIRLISVPCFFLSPFYAA
jgi:hypothetical protein